MVVGGEGAHAQPLQEDRVKLLVVKSISASPCLAVSVGRLDFTIFTQLSNSLHSAILAATVMGYHPCLPLGPGSRYDSSVDSPDLKKSHLYTWRAVSAVGCMQSIQHRPQIFWSGEVDSDKHVVGDDDVECVLEV